MLKYLSMMMMLLLSWINESLSSDIETITIMENQMLMKPLANLTDILLHKMKVPESQLRKIAIFPLSDNELLPFKLQSNQLLQPPRGVDREVICSDRSVKRVKKLCEIHECCKLIGFQYSYMSNIVEFFLLIKIRDENDQSPQFPTVRRPFVKIPENIELGRFIDLPMAIDTDSERFAVQRYFMTSANLNTDQSSDFRLYTTNDIPPKPQLIVNGKIDYERTKKYIYRLYAYDDKEPGSGNTVSTTIEIEVEDLNDNDPKFNQMSYSAEIDENKRNDKLIKFSITDPDSGRNGVVSVTINDKNDELLKKFQIFETQKNEGYLGLINALDYETDPHVYDFTLIATDQGSPPRSSTAQVQIRLKNVNDNGPRIKFKTLGQSESNSVTITEGIKIHSIIVEVRVQDPDSQLNMINCNLVDFTDLFYLDGPSKLNNLLDFKQYNLKTIATIDRESNYGDLVRVTIQCNDGDMYRSLTTNESLNIQIADVNDNPPVFSQKSYVGTVDENQINFPVMFNKPFIVTDKDSGRNGTFEFKLEDLDNLTDSADFICDRISGKIVTQRALDYELRNSYRFKIVAVDNGVEPLRSSATVTVNVVDLNDNAPKFPESHYMFNIAENVSVGTKIGKIQASDADTDRKNKDIFYSIEPRGDNVNAVEIDRFTGELRTRKPLDRESFESITFKAIARNSNLYSSTVVRSSESEVDVIIKITDVNDNPPQFKPRPNVKPRVEFIIENYVEGSACMELPYTVHDADDGGNSGQNCCYTTLENDYNKLFTLMTDTPTYICLSRKPEKYQSLTVTLIARDKPVNAEESLTSKISFSVVIKTDHTLKNNGKPMSDHNLNNQPYNDSRNLFFIIILITVVLVVLIIIIIIIFIIRRCLITDRDCDTSNFYQTIDMASNRADGTKVNYIIPEQENMLQANMSPGKATLHRGYLTSAQYSDSLHKTLNRNLQQQQSNNSSPFIPSTYHQILTNQGVRIIQNPNRFNDQNIYEWSPVCDDRERTMMRNYNNIDKMRSMSPTKASSIHASPKILNDEQHDSGYQILNPFGLSSSPQQYFVNYSPESLIPSENEMSTPNSRSLTLLNNFFDENNNGSNTKTTPRTLNKSYFQTTFV